MPAAYLLDTNVLVNAARIEPSTTDQCQRNCIQQINRWRTLGPDGKRDRLLILDQDGVILQEYLQQFKSYIQRQKAKRHSADPGLADALYAELIQFQSLTDETAEDHGIRRVKLTQIGKHENHEFAEFPHHDSQLQAFDRSDRKWVAAALACQKKHGEIPEIVNATDTDWNQVAEHLYGTYGIAVITICG